MVEADVVIPSDRPPGISAAASPAKRKAAAVLRLLCGEDLETLSRELRVTAETLSAWQDQFLASGTAGLKARETDVLDEPPTPTVRPLAGLTRLALSESRLIIPRLVRSF